jgi:hypothetical protein
MLAQDAFQEYQHPNMQMKGMDRENNFGLHIVQARVEFAVGHLSFFYLYSREYHAGSVFLEKRETEK